MSLYSEYSVIQNILFIICIGSIFLNIEILKYQSISFIVIILLLIFLKIRQFKVINNYIEI